MNFGENVNEIRIGFHEANMQITSLVDFPASLITTMRAEKDRTLEEVRKIVPAVSNLDVIPVKTKEGNQVQASSFTIEVAGTNNELSKIVELAEICRATHMLLIDDMTTLFRLKNVAKDLAPYAHE